MNKLLKPIRIGAVTLGLSAFLSANVVAATLSYSGGTLVSVSGLQLASGNFDGFFGDWTAAELTDSDYTLLNTSDLFEAFSQLSDAINNEGPHTTGSGVNANPDFAIGCSSPTICTFGAPEAGANLTGINWPALALENRMNSNSFVKSSGSVPPWDEVGWVGNVEITAVRFQAASAVPVPAAVYLLGSGIIGLATAKRYQRVRAKLARHT